MRLVFLCKLFCIIILLYTSHDTKQANTRVMTHLQQRDSNKHQTKNKTSRKTAFQTDSLHNIFLKQIATYKNKQKEPRIQQKTKQNKMTHTKTLRQEKKKQTKHTYTKANKAHTHAQTNKQNNLKILIS